MTNRTAGALLLAAFAALIMCGPVEAEPDAATGKIVIYRQGAIMGYALACPVRYEGREIVELGRNKYAEWPVPAGEYVLTNKTSSVDVIVRPGQTRYVRCQIKSGFMTGRADLQIVDKATFEEHAAEYERKEPAFTLQAVNSDDGAPAALEAPPSARAVD